MRHIILLSLASSVVSLSNAQSGLIEGPFDPSSGSYTTTAGGDLEDQNSLGWWGFQGGWAQGQVFREQVAAQRGSWGMSMTRAATFTGYASGQLLQLVPGEKYVLSGFFKPKTVWQNGLVCLDVFSGADQYQWAGINGLTSANEDKWYFAWTTFTAVHPSVVIRVVNAVNDANSVVPDHALTYWDDIAVTPIDHFDPVDGVPEPATLLVLAPGVAFLARRRRRR